MKTKISTIRKPVSMIVFGLGLWAGVTISAMAADPNNVILSNLQLGKSYESQLDRISKIEAEGYFNKEKRERSGGMRWAGKDKPDQTPDIVLDYDGMIQDSVNSVYINFNAAGDKTIYKIIFKQKGDTDVQQVRAALKERFGATSLEHGDYLYWGCPDGQMKDFCVKANVTEHSYEIEALDESIKNKWKPIYNEKVRVAKGAKKGPQF